MCISTHQNYTSHDYLQVCTITYNVSELWHQKELESWRTRLQKIRNSCPRLHKICSVLTYIPCHTIHHMTDDIMNKDTMARDMISSAMDVDEFSTVVIKFYKSFMVNELHELLCQVFYIFQGFDHSYTTRRMISLMNFIMSRHYFEFIVTLSCYVISPERNNIVCIDVFCNP